MGSEKKVERGIERRRVVGQPWVWKDAKQWGERVTLALLILSEVM